MFVVSSFKSMVKRKIIMKLFLIILQSSVVVYLIFNLFVVMFLRQSENGVIISRNCFCQSVNLNGGRESNNFRCPMTINHLGRLGNAMGEYATLLALARINGHAPYQHQSMKDELDKYFSTSMPVINRMVYENISWIGHRIYDWMSDEYSKFGCNFTLLEGFPCSWTFFHHIRDDVKREFQFQHNLVHDAQAHLVSLRKSNTTTYIGVHVRRGDYVALMYYVYNGVLANSKFFTEAMNYYRSKFKDCVFVVCSDDLKWCEKNINNSLGDVHFCWNGNSRTPGRDMALLTQCNHSIITVGTFGFWSAYLTGGQVVYLNNYLKNNSFFRNLFFFNATYLPEWIPIEADLNCTL